MTALQTAPYSSRVLPEGTVTFLFSDIEGSTQLLYRLGDQVTAVLAEHHRILREAVAHGGGQVVRTEGDAFFVAFPRATDAVAAAVEAQRSLAQHAWPEGAAIRVRMGLHTGEPEVALDDYVGHRRAPRGAHRPRGLRRPGAALGDDSGAGWGRAATRCEPAGPGPASAEGHPPAGTHLPVADRGPARRVPAAEDRWARLPPEGARLARQVGACPYRGLAAFREADAPFYCGREAFVGQLEQAVRRQAVDGGDRRLLWLGQVVGAVCRAAAAAAGGGRLAVRTAAPGRPTVLRPGAARCCRCWSRA